MARCLPECKLNDHQTQATIDDSREIFNEVTMLGESKTMKARGFNKMYEVTTRINRIIDKTSKFSTARVKPLPPSKYMNDAHIKI